MSEEFSSTYYNKEEKLLHLRKNAVQQLFLFEALQKEDFQKKCGIDRIKVMGIERKKRNIQDAQNNWHSGKKVDKKKKLSKKLSTIKGTKNRKKWSYTPSYAHYPH